jgi:Zn-dependent metalloprotease
MGLVYDYFARRHQLNSLDGLAKPINGIVHRGLINNAFFTPPPFGPSGGGAMAFGVTSAGVPITALDVAGHELTHGVTYFAVSRRTGDGIRDTLFTTSGPTSVTLGGTAFPCNVTTLGGLPFYCENGHYVLASNDSGAVNEALSDVFGTSIEFFAQPPGSGPFKADYLIAEDVSGFGPLRALNVPGSKTIATTTAPLPYPDHFSRLLQSALVILKGTRTVPVSLGVSSLILSNNAAFETATADNGGVHWNSTVLSHAFYLAIEGGQNATSKLNVQGVGAANREQIERAFFRAMKDLMPNSPSLPTAALAVYQSAVDLYGANSPAARAIGQAMVAVGLLVAA